MLKKELILLISWYSFNIFFFSFSYDYPLKLSDYTVLLFMNFSLFPNYGLSSFSFIRFISFFFLVFGALSIYLNQAAEYLSFRKMEIYRYSKKSYMDALLRSNFKSYLKSLVAFILPIIAITVLEINSIKAILSLLLLLVYLIRFTAILRFFAYVYESMSLLLSSKLLNIILFLLSILMTIIDSLYTSHFMTISSDILTEFSYLLGAMLCIFLFTVWTRKYMFKKGEIS